MQGSQPTANDTRKTNKKISELLIIKETRELLLNVSTTMESILRIFLTQKNGKRCVFFYFGNHSRIGFNALFAIIIAVLFEL